MINIKVYNQEIEKELNKYKYMDEDELVDFINDNIQSITIHDNDLNGIDKIFDKPSDMIESGFEYNQWYDYVIEDDRNNYISRNLDKEDLIEMINDNIDEEHEETYFNIFTTLGTRDLNYYDVACDWYDHESVSKAMSELVEYFINKDDFHSVTQIIKDCKKANEYRVKGEENLKHVAQN